MGAILTSVRVRLLLLALLPLLVLLPVMLGVGINRWAARFDAILIENVASDLRIAEQYLQRILANTETELRGVARSDDMRRALEQDRVAPFLERERLRLGLDFLRFADPNDAAEDINNWPIIAGAFQGKARTEVDIMPLASLAAISPDLPPRATIQLIPTEAAVQTDRTVEDRGMVVHSATPLRLEGQTGALVGGTLLNRNLGFIDTINTLVYSRDGGTDTRQGTATLFLEDVRISTNVRLFEDVRALGTRVSAEVRGAVLDEGRTWLDRAFVVNDWYISGYLPITDSFGARVGMLYVGFLEAPFAASKRSAYIAIIAAVLALLVVSVPLFLWLARGVFTPLERMNQTMQDVEEGDLSARIGPVGARDEIGEVARHLDTLLDQVQQRDHALRASAEDLNDRVDARTQELQDANKKLEATFQQLVLSEKLASIGEITAGVAHEINNPIAVIQGNVDVMRAALGSADVDVATELSLIDQQVARINAIVGKLLQFARPSEFGTDAEAVNVAQVVQDCRVLVDHATSRDAVRIEMDLAETRPVRINPGELQQIIINLMMNGLHAMDGQAGTLHVSLTQDNTHVVLRVQDSGPGIPVDTLSEIFDPFFTTKHGGGTGLGLSISQTLVQRAGGTITPCNRPEGGAEFIVSLPVV